nr:hypothetical protein Iba_chr04fCG12490 [Ipomoea batatas]
MRIPLNGRRLKRRVKSITWETSSLTSPPSVIVPSFPSATSRLHSGSLRVHRLVSRRSRLRRPNRRLRGTSMHRRLTSGSRGGVSRWLRMSHRTGSNCRSAIGVRDVHSAVQGRNICSQNIYASELEFMEYETVFGYMNKRRSLFLDICSLHHVPWDGLTLFTSPCKKHSSSMAYCNDERALSGVGVDLHDFQPATSPESSLYCGMVSVDLTPSAATSELERKSKRNEQESLFFPESDASAKGFLCLFLSEGF